MKMPKPTLNQAWSLAHSWPGQEIEFDPMQVVCDFCGADHTATEDIGGVVISSTAICPTCCNKFAESVELDRRERPDKFTDPEPGERFGDLVRRFRAMTYDGPPTVLVDNLPGPRSAHRSPTTPKNSRLN